MHIEEGSIRTRLPQVRLRPLRGAFDYSTLPSPEVSYKAVVPSFVISSDRRR